MTMMNRRHLLPMLTALGFGVVLAACGGGEPPPPPPPPPPPTLVSLTLKAAPDVNPDASGAPKPVRVRVYKLKTGQPFAETDFFALDQDPQKALGGDLVGMEEFVLAPGGTQVWQAKLEDDTRVIGITAAYFSVDQAQWRAWKEIPRNMTTLLVGDVGASAVSLREAGL